MSQAQIDPSWSSEPSRPSKAQPATPHIPQQHVPHELDAPRQMTVRSVPWRWIFVLAGVLAIVGTLYFLSQRGIVTLGIEHLWGLPNQPQPALLGASEKLAQESTYRIEGDLRFEFSQAPVLPDPSGIGSSSVGQAMGAQTLDGTFIQAVGPEASHTKFTLALTGEDKNALGPLFAPGTPVQFEFTSTATDLYLKIPQSSGNGRWFKAPRGDLATYQLTAFRWPNALRAIAEHLTNGRRDGAGTLDGEQTKGYQAEIDSQTVNQLLSAVSTGAATGTMAVTATIGEQSRRPLAFSLTGPVTFLANSGTMTIDATFRGFGTTAAPTLPNAGDTTNGTLTDWFNLSGLVATNSPSGRDARRKADLKRIGVALAAYAAAQRPFSYPKVQGTIRLDQADFFATALKDYLTPLPTDPSGSDRYYGYSSDGSGFTLTTVLEQRDDPSGTKVGDLTLFTIEAQ